MQQKIEGDYIYVKGSKEDDAIFRKWRLMKKDRKNGIWYGRISRQLLEKLKKHGGLIPPAKKALAEMDVIQDAVDAERIRPDAEVVALYPFPVKADLFKHQIRAANMAGVIFGVISPDEIKT